MHSTVDTEAVAAVLSTRLGNRRPRALIALDAGVVALADRLLPSDGDATRVVVDAIDVGLPGAGAEPPARVLVGTVAGTDVLVHCGGARLSDGIDVGAVTATVEVAAHVGVAALVTAGVATAVAPGLAAGGLCVVTDHLNLTGQSPLVGVPAPRLPAMDDVYDPALAHLARTVAARNNSAARDVVYAGVVGPEAPTAAERRMLARLGADVVGTAVVMEAITARTRGLRTLALVVVRDERGGVWEPTAVRDRVIDHTTGHLAATVAGVVEALQ